MNKKVALPDVDVFSMIGWTKMQNLKLDLDQRDAIIVSQSVRNALENFHGGMGDGKNGFLTDEQMKRLNICIRKTIYDTLKMIKGLPTTESQLKKQAKDHSASSPFTFAGFQLSTFSEEYMELPGTPELDKAYKEFVEDYDGE